MEDFEREHDSRTARSGSSSIGWTLGILAMAIVAAFLVFAPGKNATQTTGGPSVTSPPNGTTGSAPAPATRPTTPAPSPSTPR
jgi:hypothetical protein